MRNHRLLASHLRRPAVVTLPLRNRPPASHRRRPVVVLRLLRNPLASHLRRPAVTTRPLRNHRPLASHLRRPVVITLPLRNRRPQASRRRRPAIIIRRVQNPPASHRRRPAVITLLLRNRLRASHLRQPAAIIRPHLVSRRRRNMLQLHRQLAKLQNNPPAIQRLLAYRLSRPVKNTLPLQSHRPRLARNSPQPAKCPLDILLQLARRPVNLRNQLAVVHLPSNSRRPHQLASKFRRPQLVRPSGDDVLFSPNQHYPTTHSSAAILAIRAQF